MDTQSEVFQKKLSGIFVDIAQKYKLPEGTFFIKPNYSEKGGNIGKLTSTEIDINEFSYPYDEQNKIAKCTSIVLLKPDRHCWKIEVRSRWYIKENIPPSAEVAEKSSGANAYYHICFEFDDPAFFQYIHDTIIYRIEHYESSVSFSCCSKFEKCSEFMKCIHSNNLYAKGCKYRINLENGRNYLLPQQGV